MTDPNKQQPTTNTNAKPPIELIVMAGAAMAISLYAIWAMVTNTSPIEIDVATQAINFHPSFFVAIAGMFICGGLLLWLAIIRDEKKKQDNQ